MRLLYLLARACAAFSIVMLTSACEGPNWARDDTGAAIQFDNWAPIENTQLQANLAAVLSGLPLKDAKRSLRNSSVQHDVVIITDRGWANAQQVIAPNSYFNIQSFSRLGSREGFEAWVRERLPQARNIEFVDVIPVTHPRITTRGFTATLMVTSQQDIKVRCAIALAGYGSPRFAGGSGDIYRLEDLKSHLQIMLCTTNASAGLLNQRMQRVAF